MAKHARALSWALGVASVVACTNPRSATPSPPKNPPDPSSAGSGDSRAEVPPEAAGTGGLPPILPTAEAGAGAVDLAGSAGQGDADPNPPLDPGVLIRRTLSPHSTDAAIGAPNDDHVVYVPSKARNGKLLVWLPGTGGKPANLALFYETAAKAGYLTLALDYPAAVSATVCRDDLACYGSWRKELYLGVDVNPLIDVPASNSIQHRLVAALAYLDAHYAGEGWEKFLVGGQPNYSEIAFAGLSQGGGHAAWIAAQYEVYRVIMFSSVCDAAGTPLAPATWVSEPHRTPSERYFGFDHTNDVFADDIGVTWPALGLEVFGARTLVDGAAPPFAGSHQLVTSLPIATKKLAHTSVVADGSTPKLGGQPVYLDVWRYMLGP